ncbi:hypothetical protein BZG02_09565 [Labilibaculum filiforme]|uniref:Uncharacterized protein n=1 Tax=Labilibaculum filiforme TaxID=1940526 RepID=A0A2N3HY96_9BACT|nr:DUF6261 family protein [Labilibaculum filiforme]PKQ63011.1 hypothetical protein BZG02_09565 [Labilibaculum filiforme]
MEQILSDYTSKQVENIAENILFEFAKTDWSADQYLSEISSRLLKSHGILKNSIGKLRASDFTEELSKKDAIFDRDIICFKKFVDANRYMRDENKVEAATKIWKLIDAHNLNLYRLSYEEQTSSATSLFAELDRQDNKLLIEALIGASEALILAKNSNDALMSTYRESNEAKATKEDQIAASLQRKQVRDIINSDLLPYLEVMIRVNPATYKGIYQSIIKYIEAVNTKVRSRSTKNESETTLELEQN